MTSPTNPKKRALMPSTKLRRALRGHGHHLSPIMQIGAKKAVTFHYSLRDDEGTVLDSSEGKKPLTYLHGEGNIVPGLEKALEGKQAGDDVKATVPPAEGYGVRDEENVFNVPRR